MGGAVNVEPLLGVAFVSAQLASHAGSENLGSASRQ
jgi:hypothetical protein